LTVNSIPIFPRHCGVMIPTSSNMRSRDLVEPRARRVSFCSSLPV
jgi:hypothetical protein